MDRGRRKLTEVRRAVCGKNISEEDIDQAVSMSALQSDLSTQTGANPWYRRQRALLRSMRERTHKVVRPVRSNSSIPEQLCRLDEAPDLAPRQRYSSGHEIPFFWSRETRHVGGGHMASCCG